MQITCFALYRHTLSVFKTPFALGYGGNGMTLGFFAAQAQIRLVNRKWLPGDELFGFRPAAVTSPRVRGPIKK
jgi:hypothetical protein